MIPLSRVRGPGVFGPRGDSFPATARYGKRVPDASADISPAIAGTRPPRAVGDVVLAAEPLRHGLGNAATGGIWRVRGPAGSAILKVARRPAGREPARSFPTSDEPDHWNYWRREPLAYQTGLAEGPARVTQVADADWDHPGLAVWPAGLRTSPT